MISALIIATLIGASPVPEAALTFERQHISERPFEAASACDVDNDGDLDIVSGEYWYAGPDFTEEHKIGDILPVGDYYDDFSDYPMDVNGDGWIDIVTGGYWGGNLRWRENPGALDVEWPEHEVAVVGAIERNCFCDLDGDGLVEVIPVTQPVHIFHLQRDAEGRGQGAFDQFTIAQEGGGGHGIGFGDIDGDGDVDIVFAVGWFESPEDPLTDEWTWHPEFTLTPSASVPILVHDVNEDGLADLIVGEAHNYGLHWWEQGAGDDGRTWTKHMIEAGRSQYHDLQLADIDNDGREELITGKRYYAHSGHDPGAEDPVGLYYFDVDGGEFVWHTLDYGPPRQASGVGIYFWVADVDGNGWLDIIAPGKEGLFLFRNLGTKP